MQEVFASLNKKDSLVVLFEHYESSLHKADKVTESPRDDEHLVLKEDADEDEYSKLTKKSQNGFFDKNQPKPIDKKIVQLSSKIRN